MKEFSDLLSDSHFSFREDRSISLCHRCGGTGFYTTEQCVDYHRNDYETTRHSCDICKGDGRMVTVKRYIDARLREDSITIPFVEFDGDPHEAYYENIRVRLDYNSPGMNKKYPDLEKLSYNNYDELLQKYLLLETIKNANKTY